jgi:hypothetical protein
VLEHPPLDKHGMLLFELSLELKLFLIPKAAAPRFLREEEEIVYAIRGQPVTIEFWVYAHPDPNVIWF